MKRLFDIVVSSIALLLFLPAGLLIIVILRFTGEGEIFYKQQRVGKDGEIFDLLKFATMLKESPNIGTGCLTVKNDPRVLPFGEVLRKTKLNEMPQLLNILKGDMSIIGPRPQAKNHFHIFPEHVKKEIINVRPGLSGIGSIVFRDEDNILERSNKPQEVCYKEDIAPYKGELEIWYVNHQSFWLDLKLIFLTLWVVLLPKSNIYRKVFNGLPQNTIAGLYV